MTGVPLPGGVTLYGEGDSPDVCGLPGGDGIALPGGVTLYGLAVCQPLPDLLAGFSWLTDADLDRSNRLTDQINGTLATHAVPQPDNIGSYTFNGDALVSYMTLTGAYTASLGWFTDLDIEATFSITEHQTNNTAGQWAEVFHIPKTGGGGATEWAEFAPIFRDNGDVWIGFDFESGSETSVDAPTWMSGQVYATGDPNPAGVVGDWRQGIAEATWRLTIVAATGAVTLYRDGEVVTTDTMGTVAFPQPPNGEVVQAGPFQYLTLIKSISLKDGIGGDEIIGFDATTPTGWTEAEGDTTTAPVRSAYVGMPNVPFSFAAATTYDLPANSDRTLVASMRAIDPDNAWVGRNIAGLFGGQAGWAFAKFTGFGVPWAFLVGSGGAPIQTDFGAFDNNDHVLVVTIDRTADILTTYVDGGAKDTSDISALGAVAVGAVDIGGGASWIYAAGAIDRVLTHPEIIQLNDLLL